MPGGPWPTLLKYPGLNKQISRNKAAQRQAPGISPMAGPGLRGTLREAQPEKVRKMNEPFSSFYLAGLEDVDGLGELPGLPRAAAEFAQDAPGLELRVRAFAGSA